jgi:hypothetical protein
MYDFGFYQACMGQTPTSWCMVLVENFVSSNNCFEYMEWVVRK